MRAFVGLMMAALILSACANSSLSTLELVVYDEFRRPVAVPMQLLEKGVSKRLRHIDWNSVPRPTFGEVIAAAIRQVPDANALANVTVIQQIRYFRPFFFDRHCITVRGDAVRIRP
jgi:hypothetical protein